MDIRNAAELVQQGMKMSVEDVSRSENRLDQDDGVSATSIELRVKLLGYYFLARLGSSASADDWSRHLVALIRNNPASELFCTPYVVCTHFCTMDIHVHIGGEWLHQIRSHSRISDVFGNAAMYFRHFDPALADGLLRQAICSTDDARRWGCVLASLESSPPYGQGKINDSGAEIRFRMRNTFLENALSETEDVPSKCMRTCALAESAKAMGVPSEAARIVDIALEAAGQVRGTPAGERVHHRGNILKGQLALAIGNVDGAVQHMLSSAELRRLGDLAVFDPDLALAEALLAAGKLEAVIQYLSECENLWTDGKQYFVKWIEQIRRGEIPALWEWRRVRGEKGDLED